MSKIFSFRPQQNVGNVGEALFVRYYKFLGATKSEERKFDFVLADGTKIELKTDTYPMEKTPNLFIEHVSNTKSGSLGGPWRAENDKVDFFVYFFLSNGVFFWFEPSSLRKRIEKLIIEKKLKPKIISNTSWETIGYAINREEISDLIRRQDIF